MSPTRTSFGVLAAGLLALLASGALAAPADVPPSAVEERDTQANGIGMHYAIAGTGAGLPVVLLHGWPETSYAWRKLMPMLAARGHQVVAPDLRGFGGSDKLPGGYDTRTMAEDVHQLVQGLGLRRILLVGHDMGMAVAYAYAAAYPEEVDRLVLMEMVVPGFGSDELAQNLWHFGFNKAPALPEALIAGREQVWLEYFYTRSATVPEAISAADVQHYVRAYAAPGAVAGSLGIYRALDVSAEQNRAALAVHGKLQTPVLAIASAHVVGERTLASVRAVVANVETVLLDACGHFIAEECPGELDARLAAFFTNRTADGSGPNSTDTRKQ